MTLRSVTFHGGSLSRVRSFPTDARRDAGHALFQIQRGLDPSDWKPMPTVGSGVHEIRVRDGSGAYRVIYIATLADSVHVLHAFQKKSQRTARHDIEIATLRLRQLKRGN